METIAVDFNNIDKAGPAWSEYFQLRRQEFVDLKQWQLPTVEGVEFDWYDRPGARWIIVKEDGHCIGGARLLRTDTPAYGPGSYMLRDAQLGLISGIPPEMIPPNLPLSPDLFEATRFFVSRTLPLKKQMRVQKEIVRKAADTAKDLGGSTLIALMPSQIYRVFRGMGFEILEHNVEADIDDIPHSVAWLSIK